MDPGQPVYSPVILLGLGFTTQRLARLLLLPRTPVIAIARDTSRFACLASLGLPIREFHRESLPDLPRDATVVHTIPPLPEAENMQLRSFLHDLNPKRVIYISSTGVYGQQAFVDANSAPSPSEIKGLRRVEEEDWCSSQTWSSLVLRAAAIYGPGRGVHVRIRAGQPPRTAGNSVVSRIHVDDLAAILEAAAGSRLEGAWPVADDQPCSTSTISEWCAKLLRIQPTLPSGHNAQETGRYVDGREIRARLGVELTYPGYREGILASYARERATSERRPEVDSASTT